MEHIVQFAIGIDDKAIQERIEEHAYSDVLAKLTKNAVDSVFAHTSAYSRDTMWKSLMEDALQSFLEERKDEIIEHARRPVPTDEEVSGSHGCCHRKGR